MNVKTERFFYALGDGDKIRERVEYYLFSEELENLSKFSKSLVDAVNNMSDDATALMEARILMAGGDDVLFLINKDKYQKEFLLQMSQTFEIQTGNSFSFGVGETITIAYLNLRKAKSLGGGRVVE